MPIIMVVVIKFFFLMEKYKNKYRHYTKVSINNKVEMYYIHFNAIQIKYK